MFEISVSKNKIIDGCIVLNDFLQLPKNIQKIFIDWCQLRIYDLFLKDYDNGKSFKRSVVSCERNDNILINNQMEVEWFPLLHSYHLIRFIEDKKCGKLDIYKFKEEYVVEICDKKYNTNSLDLLQALWLVSIEIAKEEFEISQIDA